MNKHLGIDSRRTRHPATITRAAFERRGFHVSTYSDRPAAWHAVYSGSCRTWRLLMWALGSESGGRVYFAARIYAGSQHACDYFLTARDKHIDSVHAYAWAQ